MVKQEGRFLNKGNLERCDLYPEMWNSVKRPLRFPLVATVCLSPSLIFSRKLSSYLCLSLALFYCFHSLSTGSIFSLAPATCVCICVHGLVWSLQGERKYELAYIHTQTQAEREGPLPLLSRLDRASELAYCILLQTREKRETYWPYRVI